MSDTSWSGGYMLHYNGSRWQEIPGNSFPTPLPTLRDVWGNGSNDVFVVGDSGTVLHFDGSNWQSMHSGTSMSLRFVGGTGPKDVYVTGDFGTLLHHDGYGWSPMRSGMAGIFSGIWHVPSSNAMFFGGYDIQLTDSRWSSRGVIYRMSRVR